MDIEYDSHKAQLNIEKHGVMFNEAATVLLDDMALVMDDPDHPEERFVMIGMSNQLHLLVVVYTYRHDKIRLISARQATKKEERYYAQGI